MRTIHSLYRGLRIPGPSLVIAMVMVGCAALFVTAPLAAAGGSSSAPPPPPAPEDPMVTATRHYHLGVRAREKATKLEAGGEADAKAAKKLEKAWRNAERNYRQAVELNPQYHEAWSDLGYVLRRQGQYQESLTAYDRALALSPTYGPAIEYRGEAYVRLGRFDEAKEAYMTLFQNDRALADQLLESMKRWLMSDAADAGIEAGALEAFSTWVEERSQIAHQVPSGGVRTARAW